MDADIMRRVYGWAEATAAAGARAAAAAAATAAVAAVEGNEPFGCSSSGSGGAGDWNASQEAAAAAIFPLAPSWSQHHHHDENVRFELLMTAVASALIVAMWVGGVALWYVYCVRRPPRLYLGRGDVIRQVAESCPSLSKPYCPPIWCISPWAQAGVSIQRVTSIRAQLASLGGADHARSPVRREIVALSDDQEVYLNWFRPHDFQGPASQRRQLRAVALLLHGVTGSSFDHYELADRLNGVGIMAVGFDRRGHGGLPLKRPRFNTTGDQDDLKEIIDLISARYPSVPLFAVGYSAGSSLLGRYLGEQGEESHIDGAVLVSPGFDMEEAILCGHLHPLADYYLTQIAKSLFLDGLEKVDLSKRQGEAIRRMKTCRSMREFHAELHHFTGHSSSDEYFKSQNPGPHLKDIARPTLFVNSVDDFMFPKDLIQPWTWLASANENIAMVQTRWGGHCCFYEGPLSLQPASWAEKVVEEFLTALADREAPRMIERRISRTNSRLQLPSSPSSSLSLSRASSSCSFSRPGSPSPAPILEAEEEESAQAATATAAAAAAAAAAAVVDKKAEAAKQLSSSSSSSSLAFFPFRASNGGGSSSKSTAAATAVGNSSSSGGRKRPLVPSVTVSTSTSTSTKKLLPPPRPETPVDEDEDDGSDAWAVGAAAGAAVSSLSSNSSTASSSSFSLSSAGRHSLFLPHHNNPHAPTRMSLWGQEEDEEEGTEAATATAASSSSSPAGCVSPLAATPAASPVPPGEENEDKQPPMTRAEQRRRQQRAAGGREEAEYARKESVKAVMMRAGIVGWALMIAGLVGVLAGAGPWSIPLAAGASL